MPAPNLLGRCRPTGERIRGTCIPIATLVINQHSYLDKVTLPCKKTKQNWIINKKLKKTCSRGGRVH
jgi:hypothetical protein